MTAPQCSSRAMARSVTFAAAVKTAFEELNIDVEVARPAVDVDVDYLMSFDKIVVGVSPVLSLSSNYAYGALSILSLVLDVSPEKLILFVDSPDPSAVRSNALAVSKSPSSLFKPFHSARKDYSKARENEVISSRIEKAINFLSREWDVVTLYPDFPFFDRVDAEKTFCHVSQSKLVGFQCDALYVQNRQKKTGDIDSQIWCVDTDKTQWFRQTKASLKKDYVLMKANKGSDDHDVENVISSSLGAIISPASNGHLWWSHRYVQTLNSGVPIATEWRKSSVLGTSWSILASSLEETPQDERLDIAEEQRNAYLNTLEDRYAVVKSLVERIGLDSHDNTSI